MIKNPLKMLGILILGGIIGTIICLMGIIYFNEWIKRNPIANYFLYGWIIFFTILGVLDLLGIGKIIYDFIILRINFLF